MSKKYSGRQIFMYGFLPLAVLFFLLFFGVFLFG